MLETRLTGYALKSQTMQIIIYPTHADLFHFQIFYKKPIRQEPINVITENNFFEGFFISLPQESKNSFQALLLLIEQMSHAISSGKYGIAVMIYLEGAFDTVWREGVIYKLHKAAINNLLSVSSSFLNDRYSRNLMDSHTSDWFQTTSGYHNVPY